MKKILKGIYYLVFSVIIFVALILVISALPIAGNIKTLTVLSGSMEPAIHTGSVVVIKPVSNYEVGDVVTFSLNSNQIPTTHRITEIRVASGEMVYKTKGDANNSEDSREVFQKEVSGKVYFSIPYLGYLVDFVQKPFGLMLVVVIFSLIVISGEIKKIVKEVLKMKEKKNLEKKDGNNKE